MLIIPAIDIRGGKCVRLYQGDYNRETVFGNDPAEMARRWTRQGARFIHVVDLDGAREGTPRNREWVRRILEAVSIPVQVGGGIRRDADIETYLAWGARRVILGTAAFRNPDFLEGVCRRWPGRIAVDIAAKDGMASISGWTQETETRAVDLARQCQERGASCVIFTDVLRDGAQEGINVEGTRLIARALKIPVIASGGISNLADVISLLEIEKEGVTGLIVGKALYAGRLDLREAISVGEGKRA